MSVKVQTPAGTVHYFDEATRQKVEAMTEASSPMIEPDRKPKTAKKTTKK